MSVAIFSRSTSQAAPTGVATTVVFDEPAIITEDGDYTITGHIVIAGNPNTGLRSVSINVNGVAQSQVEWTPAAPQSRRQSVPLVATLAADDVLTLVLWHNATNAPVVIESASLRVLRVPEPPTPPEG